MTPDEAIAALRTLPADRQQAILGQLDDATKQSILQKLKAPSAPSPGSDLSNVPGALPGMQTPQQAAGIRTPQLQPQRTGGTPMVMSSGMTPEQSIARAQSIERNAPLPMQLVGGVAKAGGELARPVLDVAALQSGQNPEDVSRMLTPQGTPQQLAKYLTLGGAAATMIPAAIAAPAATAAGIGGGVLGAGAGQVVGNMAGLTPAQTQVLSDMGALGGGGLAAYRAGELFPGSVSQLGSQMRQYVRPTPSPSVVPPAETAAERLLQSIRPQGGIKPATIEAVQQEGPAIVEYAQRTGNPLNTRAEGFKAAQGVASENLEHYNKNFFEPNKNLQVQLPDGVSDELGHVTTIEKINKRISDINDQMRATSGKSEGATMTAEQRTGLEGEVRDLRQRLYQALSEKTGVSPDAIRDMREGYGGQYAIADALQSGRMDSLGRTASVSQGGSALNVPRDIWSVPDRIWQGVRGGEDAIANRQFAERIRAFSPQAPNRPMPQAPTPQPYATPFSASPEMQARLNARGSAVQPSTVLPRSTFTAPSNNPLPSVSEVPSLRGDAQSAQDLWAQKNAAYAQAKIDLFKKSWAARGMAVAEAKNLRMAGAETDAARIEQLIAEADRQVAARTKP